MMKHRWSLLSILLLLGLLTWWKLPRNDAVVEARESVEIGKAYYTCPMHPQVKQDHEGDCPICHMKLVKVESTSPSSDHPSAPKKIKFYRHPMNPKITSAVPAKDNMGMDYLPVYEEADESSVATLSLNAVQLKNLRAQIALVKMEDLIFEIAAPGRALSSNQFSFQVYEQDLSNVKVGQKVLARSPFVTDKEIEGKVTSVDSFLDPMTRTARVNVSVSNAPTIKNEGSLSGRILVSLGQRLVIPRASVFHTGLKDYAFVYREQGVFEPRAVILGIKTDAWYEIKEGLKEGDKISAGPNFLLDSEARIRGLTDGEQR